MRKVLSIIFPTYNNWLLTEKCLESIMNSKFPRESLEVIVVDNNSKDKTVQNIRKNFPDVKILPQKSNLKFSKAINLGAKYTNGDWLFITNNDVTIRPNFFQILINFAEKNPKIGVCGGKIITTSNGQIFFDGPTNISRLTSQLKRLKNYQKTQTVDYISGAGMMIKKEVFSTLHGFDPKFPFYFEDLDFCLRAKKTGYKILYCPNAIMYHNQSSTAKNMPHYWQNYVFYEGKIRTIAKHFPILFSLTSLFAQFLFFTFVLLKTGTNNFGIFYKTIKTVGLKQVLSNPQK